MAEIVLITGTPGAGKTAHMVHMLVNDSMFKNSDGTPRKIFTNIKGLNIPEMPTIDVSSIASEQPESTDEKLSFHDIYKWIVKPENHGSVVIIDEVQDVWPARSNGSQVPPNVAWLNTHRHLGVDIFVLTQNPKNIDVNLRGLVNKHLHVAKNKLGMRTLLEWKYCANNPLTQAKDAFAKVHKLDKKIFGYYKSAEVHTENKTKVSKWVFVLPIVLLIMPVALYFSYSLLKNMASKDKVVEAAAASAPAATDGDMGQQLGTNSNMTQPQNTLGAKPEDFVPRMAERPETKPIYDGQRQVQAMEWPVGCIINTKKVCTCYSEQGTKIKEINQQLCKSYVADGLPFNPYKRPEQEQQQANQAGNHGDDGSTAQVAQMGGKPLPSLNNGDSEVVANIQ